MKEASAFSNFQEMKDYLRVEEGIDGTAFVDNVVDQVSRSVIARSI